MSDLDPDPRLIAETALDLIITLSHARRSRADVDEVTLAYRRLGAAMDQTYGPLPAEPTSGYRGVL